MPLKKMKNKVDFFTAKGRRQVFFFDEGRFGLQPQVGRSWTPQGAKATLTVKPGYTNFYVYSSVSPLTGRHFSLFLPTVNTEAMSLYLKELALEFPKQKLLVIMDQAGWHKAKDLEVPDNIQLEFLPPYSPELNPVERLWQWLRRHACRNRFFESEGEIMDQIQLVLANLSQEKTISLCRANYLFH